MDRIQGSRVVQMILEFPFRHGGLGRGVTPERSRLIAREVRVRGLDAMSHDGHRVTGGAGCRFWLHHGCRLSIPKTLFASMGGLTSVVGKEVSERISQ